MNASEYHCKKHGDTLVHGKYSVYCKKGADRRNDKGQPAPYNCELERVKA